MQSAPATAPSPRPRSPLRTLPAGFLLRATGGAAATGAPLLQSLVIITLACALPAPSLLWAALFVGGVYVNA